MKIDLTDTEASFLRRMLREIVIGGTREQRREAEMCEDSLAEKLGPEPPPPASRQLVTKAQLDQALAEKPSGHLSRADRRRLQRVAKKATRGKSDA